MTNSASLSLLNACNITPLIIDIPNCKPRHFLMGEKSPSAACRTEWAEAEPHSLSQSVSWHRRRLRRLPRYFSQVSHSLRRQNKPSGLNNNKRKKKKRKILFSTCTPLDVKKSARQNISEMGAFRVLLGSLHYMGLYMQLSVSTRQAGHGEIENHISGNGRCELRFGLLFFHGKGGCGEGGTGDAICSYAEVELNKRASHGLEAGADDDAN